ncbi:MAG TPA: 2-phosphosulfolactate phosphatase [Tepidisphaeraceae bacterium]|nr:2-phosphosulfolactate phosphatase [Tepidisphaeraceae bacterium]
MRVDVVFLPRHAQPADFENRSVAVFDVLRATTTMTVALAQGVRQIQVFDDLDSARAAAREAGGASPKPLLVGETQCLPPADFDLGNSPVAMAAPGLAADLRGRTLLMSTTNGTRAIVAARDASLLIAAALVNARAAARALAAAGRDVVLLCAGTNGQIAAEDVVGAGAVARELESVDVEITPSDSATIAMRSFDAARHDLRAALASSAGGRNVIAAGLESDVDFAARLNAYEVVGRVLDGPLRVERA